MGVLSDVQIWKPFLVVIGLYALIFLGFKGRAFVLCVALTLAVSEGIVVRTLKSVCRPPASEADANRPPGAAAESDAEIAHDL